MRLTIVLFGWTFDWTAEPTTAEDEPAASLDGGTLLSDRIDPGRTDMTLGFTGGWEAPDDRGMR